MCDSQPRGSFCIFFFEIGGPRHESSHCVSLLEHRSRHIANAAPQNETRDCEKDRENFHAPVCTCQLEILAPHTSEWYMTPIYSIVSVLASNIRSELLFQFSRHSYARKNIEPTCEQSCVVVPLKFCVCSRRWNLRVRATLGSRIIYILLAFETKSCLLPAPEISEDLVCYNRCYA